MASSSSLSNGGRGHQEPLVPVPERRRLRVYAFDPLSSRLSAARSAGEFLTVSVPMEPLERGPAGRLVQVVDYHPPTGTWFWPIDLDDPNVAHTDGLRPSETDPRTHQQVVYAVASSVIERFERFLGRRFRWSHQDRLVLVPHAFEGRNAFFDPTRKAVLFGYFTSVETSGPTLPGQRIFTCLSTDIIAHEVTHALVHRMRRHFISPTNPDVLAWHEAFADLVALFHHFAFESVVRDAVASSRGDLTRATGLFDLAREFGLSVGRGAALRNAIERLRPESGPSSDPSEKRPSFSEVVEPHERGAVFVSAVFDAFVTSYTRSIEDLLRIATDGTGILPQGHLHPDLVTRVTREAVVTADRYLGMVVRSFDYLPVVDVTFSDVLRAIVTSDRDLYPDDDAGLRGTLVEAFRRQGIYPDDVASLADDSLAWPSAPRSLVASEAVRAELGALVGQHAMELQPAGARVSGEAPASAKGEGDRLARALSAWVHDREVAMALGLEPQPNGSDKDRTFPIEVKGQHASFRRAQDGQPQPEIVIQLLQRRKDLEARVPGAGASAPVYAGTTVVMTMRGEVRYVIAKPLPAADVTDPTESGLTGRAGEYRLRVLDVGEMRLRRMIETIEADERSSVTSMWSNASPGTTFQRLHLFEGGQG